jgi:hypothetical protein
MNTPQHLPPRHSGLDPESSHANDGAQSAPLDTRLRGYDETTAGNVPYQPFEGICLTDTFQMYEKDDLVDALLVDNSARRNGRRNWTFASSSAIRRILLGRKVPTITTKTSPIQIWINASATPTPHAPRPPTKMPCTTATFAPSAGHRIASAMPA